MILVSNNAHIVFIPFPSPGNRHIIFRGDSLNTRDDGKLILHTKSTKSNITTSGNHPIHVVVPARIRTDNPDLRAFITKTDGPGPNNPFQASADETLGNSSVLRLTQEPITLIMQNGIADPSEGGALYHCYSLGNTHPPVGESRYDLVFKYSFRANRPGEPAIDNEFFSAHLAFGKFRQAPFSEVFKQYYLDCQPINDPSMIPVDHDPEVIVTPGGPD